MFSVVFGILNDLQSNLQVTEDSHNNGHDLRALWGFSFICTAVLYSFKLLPNVSSPNNFKVHILLCLTQQRESLSKCPCKILLKNKRRTALYIKKITLTPLHEQVWVLDNRSLSGVWVRHTTKKIVMYKTNNYSKDLFTKKRHS